MVQTGGVPVRMSSSVDGNNVVEGANKLSSAKELSESPKEKKHFERKKNRIIPVRES